MRIYFIVFLLMLVAGCTTVSKLEYEATTTDAANFNTTDLDKIDEIYEKDPNTIKADNPGSYYLAKNQAHWDILTIQHTNTGLLLSITRISKHLRDFSEGWKQDFKAGMKSLIEYATNKPVEINQVSP